MPGPSSQLDLFLYSTYSDTTNFIILPGNWDKLEIEIKLADGSLIKQKSGHFVPVKEKAETSWLFYRLCLLQRMGLQNQIPFSIAPKEEIHISISAEQYTDLLLFPDLIIREGSQSLDFHGLLRYIFQFLFLGIIGILFIYHFVFFLGYRERLYIFYAMYMACMIIHTLDYNGLNSEVFIKNFPQLRPFIKVFADHGIVIFYLLLLRHIVQPGKYGTAYGRWIKGLIIFYFMCYGLSTVALLFSNKIMTIMSLNLLVTLPAMIIVVIIANPVYRSKDRAAKYFITGSLFLLLGNMLNTLMYSLGIEGPAIFGYFDRIQVFQVSSLIELIWFSFAVAQRSRRIDIERDRIKTIDRMKSRLFTYVFEQSRTPLTMILGPTRSILNTLRKSDDLEKGNLQYYLESIDRNALRLQEGTNQLLELAKVDEGKMKIRAKKILLEELLQKQILFFRNSASEQGIMFQVENPHEDLEIYVDVSKLEQILESLLKRAFLKVNSMGLINLLVSKSEEFVHIEVWNSGAGIPAKQVARIFERFYNFELEQPQFRNVFGVRMALSWELSKMLAGELKVKSEEGKYTAFTLSLPLGNNHLNEYELIDSEKEPPENETILLEQAVYDIQINGNDAEKERWTVLIIEADSEIRRFIVFELQQEFNIIQASDGEDGFALATEHIPDLVISDVQMPKLNGFDLARKLKMEKTTEHIPIVLLSGQSDDKFQLDGYKLGIDTFLTKPFDPALLKEQVRNMIKQRVLLKAKYLQEYFASPVPASNSNGEDVLPLHGFSENDQAFIKKVKESLDQNFHKLDYSVEKLASDSHYQRRQLTRKVKDIFGTTPKDLIRAHRLKKACELLLNSSQKVAEIAEQVGYAEGPSFSKVFKDHFGETPTSYRKTHTEEPF